MNLTVYRDGAEIASMGLKDGDDPFNAGQERAALDIAYEEKQRDATAVVSVVVNTNPLPPVGARVRLKHNVDRYPHFIAPAGATGTVTHAGIQPGEAFTVKLDQHIDGAEEWENELLWSVSDGDEPADDLEVLKVYMDFRFDVTTLTDEERGHLAGYVSAQAEGGDPESYYPSVAFEQDIVEVEQ